MEDWNYTQDPIWLAVLKQEPVVEDTPAKPKKVKADMIEDTPVDTPVTE
jgi:hypothetical protein